ncbi:hypothetical protein SAVIM40S_07753 [Streptomyces avidinii]
MPATRRGPAPPLVFSQARCGSNGATSLRRPIRATAKIAPGSPQRAGPASTCGLRPWPPGVSPSPSMTFQACLNAAPATPPLAAASLDGLVGKLGGLHRRSDGRCSTMITAPATRSGVGCHVRPRRPGRPSPGAAPAPVRRVPPARVRAVPHLRGGLGRSCCPGPVGVSLTSWAAASRLFAELVVVEAFSAVCCSMTAVFSLVPSLMSALAAWRPSALAALAASWPPWAALAAKPRRSGRFGRRVHSTLSLRLCGGGRLGRRGARGRSVGPSSECDLPLPGERSRACR